MLQDYIIVVGRVLESLLLNFITSICIMVKNFCFTHFSYYLFHSTHIIIFSLFSPYNTCDINQLQLPTLILGVAISITMPILVICILSLLKNGNNIFLFPLPFFLPILLGEPNLSIYFECLNFPFFIFFSKYNLCTRASSILLEIKIITCLLMWSWSSPK
jgi:hypothetical protein